MLIKYPSERLSFLAQLNNPQEQLKNVIHVAGTNGKGSTVAFMQYILQAHGFSVNVFTSPHLVSYNERIRIKGSLITNEYLNILKLKLKKIIGYNLTMFEESTALAFIAFAENPADFCILETGMGGRLDATNSVSNPILNIITSISLDHEAILGDTTEKIAFEKAGIIKKSSFSVVTDYQNESVLHVIQNVSEQAKVPFIAGGVNYQIDNSLLFYSNKIINLDNLGLSGEHQKYNAALAVVSLMQIPFLTLETNKIYKGLSEVKWPARLQKLSVLYGIKAKNHSLYIDGAHNISGAKAIVNFITKDVKKYSHVYIIIGMLKRKPIEDFLSIIANINKYTKLSIMPVQIEESDSFSVKEITEITQLLNINTINLHSNTVAKTITNYLSFATKESENNLIIICGSLYLMGSILQENKIVLT